MKDVFENIQDWFFGAVIGAGLVKFSWWFIKDLKNKIYSITDFENDMRFFKNTVEEFKQDLGEMKTDVKRLDQIYKEVHGLVSRKDGTYLAMLEVVTRMEHQSQEDRDFFMKKVGEMKDDYDQKFLILSNQQRSYERAK